MGLSQGVAELGADFPSVIIGRRVTPAEMRLLEHDDSFWRRVDDIVNLK
jgi:hypothetical protein